MADSTRTLSYVLGVIFILGGLYAWYYAYSLGSQTAIFKSMYPPLVLKEIPEVKFADRYKYGFYLSGSTIIVLGLLLIIFW